MNLIPLRGKAVAQVIASLLTFALLFGATILLLLFPASESHAHAAAAATITPVSDPVAVITSPTNNTVFSTSQAPVTITAQAIAGGSRTIVQVNFTVDGTVIGSATTSPYSASWTTLTPGSHSLQAIVIVNDGSSFSSPSVTVTVQASGTPTATPPTGAACQVHYQVVNQWPGGFTASITITNTGSTTFNNWALSFMFPGDQGISQIWNATVIVSGKLVTIISQPYNSSLPPGRSVSLGFNGTWTTNNTPPTSFTLNGVPCTTV